MPVLVWAPIDLFVREMVIKQIMQAICCNTQESSGGAGGGMHELVFGLHPLAEANGATISAG